jgi:UDP-glucose 4-epimerase
MEKQKKKCLITGALGFVGKNLCKRLLEEGHDVIGLDNYEIGKATDEVEGVRYLPWDIEQIEYLKGDGIDLCFHLAALSRIQPSFEQPSETFRVNTRGTEAVCEWARQFNVKVVYSGSSSQWHDPFLSPYAMYKKLGEDVCKMYKKIYNLNVEIARFYNVFGPGEIVDGKWAAVIGLWRRQVRDGEPITIVGDGEQRRDFTHIDDIVDALIRIGFGTESVEDAWELGTGFNYSLNEVADIFIEKFGCEKKYIPQQKGNYQQTLRENDLALEKLDWKPTNRLKEYINGL